MKIATAEQMRLCDRKAMEEFGIPGIVLMENAGLGTVSAVEQIYGNPRGRQVAVVVGPGNNGGDGLVIARLLHRLGAEVQVFLLVPPEKFRGDAAVNFAAARELPLAMDYLPEGGGLEKLAASLRKSWLIIDAIFGTGLTRPVAGHFAEVIDCLNQAGPPVVAVDIPSGLCSDSGRPLGISVRARLTTTYGLAKVGQVIQPGVRYVGRLEVIDIGIPPEVVKAVGIRQELLAPEVVGAWLPERRPEGHKGTFGHLMIVAGSVGKSGAALLGGQGALRSGVGLVTLCAPKRLADIFSAALIEAMTLPLRESDGFFSGKDLDFILREAAQRSALVLGPGLGTEQETGELVAGLYRKLAVPMVIDADGLNLLARNLNLLKNPPGPRILTPHPGEMARLCGLSASEVQQDRVKAAMEFATRFKLTLVLKGASTVVAGADGNIAVNPTGNPGMAAGGMGDVLAGLLGGLLAQGISPWKAACLGVFVHGLAADRLVETEGMPFGYLASEVAAELPRAFGGLRAED